MILNRENDTSAYFWRGRMSREPCVIRKKSSKDWSPAGQSESTPNHCIGWQCISAVNHLHSYVWSPWFEPQPAPVSHQEQRCLLLLLLFKNAWNRVSELWIILSGLRSRLCNKGFRCKSPLKQLQARIRIWVWVWIRERQVAYWGQTHSSSSLKVCHAWRDRRTPTKLPLGRWWKFPAINSLRSKEINVKRILVEGKPYLILVLISPCWYLNSFEFCKWNLSLGVLQ